LGLVFFYGFDCGAGRVYIFILITSIISYVDLLKREDGLSDQAKEYVGILSDKSNRLKSIVSDLFELAKSTSRDLKLELEEIDIRKLIQQTLGEMSDIIETSGIQIRTELPEEAVVITSDGNKLYRVLQNIIDNALKYSLKDTRVYVKLENNGIDDRVTVINTSAYEMSFTEEEIFRRFYRGDEARSGEGSGLGLSIAESFTRNLGGRLRVVIDSDQFKVIMEFPL
jgi:signal transduction histidine kinase